MRQEILQFINSKYRKGTKFIDLVRNTEFEVLGDNSAMRFTDYGAVYIKIKQKSGFPNRSARVYIDGIYAKIVNDNEFNIIVKRKHKRFIIVKL